MAESWSFELDSSVLRGELFAAYYAVEVLDTVGDVADLDRQAAGELLV
jgi:hypothetical protein